MKTCKTCKWHQRFTDEINGRIYDDGCICLIVGSGNKKATHIESCIHPRECPVWEKKE